MTDTTYTYGKLTIPSGDSFRYGDMLYRKKGVVASILEEAYKTLTVKIISFIAFVLSVLSLVFTMVIIINSMTARKMGYGYMDESQGWQIFFVILTIVLMIIPVILPERRKYKVNLQVTSNNSVLPIDTFKTFDEASAVKDRINIRLAQGT